MSKFKYAQIGTVSEGTMRPEDLIPDFCGELEYYAKKNHNRKHLAMIDTIRQNMEKPDYYKSEDAEYDLNDDLFEALNEYALPYFYFGSHPGNGSDYGFWLSEMFEDDFDGLKIADLNSIPIGYTGEVLHINERGNMSLYKSVNGRLYEIWAIV